MKSYKRRQDAVETPEVVPRRYILAYTTPERVKIGLSPSAYVMASVLLSTEAELDDRLKRWQSFRIEHAARKHHSRSDSPVFRLDGRNAKLLDMPFDDLKNTLVEKIASSSREGAKTLWVVGGNDVIQDAQFWKRGLSGKVRRKANSRGDRNFRHTSIGNPLLTPSGGLAINRVMCECPNAFFEDGKERAIETLCYHAALLNTAFYLSLRGDRDLVKFKFGKPSNPAIPFHLTPNDLESARFLDMDTLVAYYILGNNLFSIDRKLSRLGYLHFSRAVETMVRDGNMRFEVLRQELKKTDKDTPYIAAVDSLLKRMRGALLEDEFRRVGYVLEYEGSRYETVGERYRKGDLVISLVYSERLPPHYIIKELGQRVDLYGDEKVVVQEHPFSRINRKERTIDDSTRRECYSRILLPGSVRGAKRRLWVPDPVYTEYRRVRREVARAA